MGDGNINKNGQLRICLSEKDKEHLHRLSEYIPGKITSKRIKTSYSEGNFSFFTINDKIMSNKFLQIFNINGPKTTNPPDLSILDNIELFVSFFIGFFDADGTFDIKKGRVKSLKIEIHGSWLYNLEYMKNLLEKYLDIKSSVSISTRGFSLMRINTIQSLYKLKEFAYKNELPILSRKWDFVDV